jgi:hypothetical protein
VKLRHRIHEFNIVTALPDGYAVTVLTSAMCKLCNTMWCTKNHAVIIDAVIMLFRVNRILYESNLTANAVNLGFIGTAFSVPWAHARIPWVQAPNPESSSSVLSGLRSPPPRPRRSAHLPEQRRRPLPREEAASVFVATATVYFFSSTTVYWPSWRSAPHPTALSSCFLWVFDCILRCDCCWDL